MPGRTTSATALAEGVATPRTAALSPLAFRFLVIVVVVQGGHVIEHIVQPLQVFVFGVPEDDALGLLGYVLQFNGTEEWLHLGFNSLYLLSLYALILPLWRITPAVLPSGRSPFPGRERLGGDLAHGRARRDHLQRDRERRLPCPGIGDAALGLSDTILHLFYNGVAYARRGARSRVRAPRSRLYVALARPRVPARFARHERRDATSAIEFACLADRHAPHRIGGPDCACLLHEPAVATIEERCSTA